MIARVCGKIIEKNDNSLLIDINGISYKVFVPTTIMQRVNESLTDENKINLVTYHYFQVEPSKSIPILIGFLNEMEKEFFEIFITVSGVGPRAALKALNRPISSVVRAIEDADMGFLQSLPGIGRQRAGEIVAKLQNKIGKFGLIQDNDLPKEKIKTIDIEKEAMVVLTQLEYKRAEASGMIKKALEAFPCARTTEELLNLVYKQKKG